MTDFSKNTGVCHPPLSKAVFELIKHPTQTIIDVILWRMDAIEATCETLSLLIHEANQSRQSDFANTAVAKIFSLLENELRLLKLLIEQGLQDKNIGCSDCERYKLQIDHLEAIIRSSQAKEVQS